MGEDPTDPDLYGDDCDAWPAGKTPKFLWASFSNIVDCNPAVNPNKGHINRIIKMTQDGVSPCKYAGTDAAGFRAGYVAHGLGGNSELRFWFGADQYFFHAPAGIGQTFFTNQLLCGLGAFGENGIGQIAWLEEDEAPSIKTIMSKIALPNEEPTVFHYWPVASDKMIVRFANKNDKTSIYVETDGTI